MSLTLDKDEFFLLQHSSTETSGDTALYLMLASEIPATPQGQSGPGQSSAYLIGCTPQICGGAPIIIGTRISVHHLIEALTRLGEKSRLGAVYPQLSAGQIDAAEEYYRQHPAEIEELIEEETRSEFAIQ
ncbi:MAG: hypothetical protein CO113_16305 [Elusimicrobia bacterium CG_4_9_14_3_um_filter_62_55]|nr:MAG: hypothetical protein COR54_18560 [Elusimicrobia bacterium CG22_combo_CG10-13_8_21_14_all_63_91]PJA18031.1 MAG: hypothetical protein COX66_02395 [Elusimicrobia bacterium CG_4_10_14_0_2_um_filter_63_34]PJB23887.1 MAG: hypothetical protein CO113_16305 [Elusimicrobia bacterium CG_4_9_14_3_um_filter_62_55]